jgi:hypothetical protein
MMTIGKALRAAWSAWSGALVLVAAAQAALLPNGNPTGTNPAVGPGGKSTLFPAPAQYVSAASSPWLTPGLDAQGFSAANGWTVNKIALQGNIRLDRSLPWTDAIPSFSQGEFLVFHTPEPGFGGAEIGLHYLPSVAGGSTDPHGAGVHWISVIHDNDPLDYELANGVAAPGGYTISLDNGYLGTLQAPGNPFYDGLAADGFFADTSDFLDVPFDLLKSGADIEFQTFIATWSPNDQSDPTKGGTINVYDGVAWGVQLPVPEPSTLALAALALSALVAQQMTTRRRQSVRAARNQPAMTIE